MIIFFIIEFIIVVTIITLGYIELESNLRCFDRCRVIYEKYLEFNPANCTTWISFAKMEAELGDYERAKGGIYYYYYKNIWSTFIFC
jgi:hypothetical protein